MPGVEMWAKCEFLNPGGSVKDRAAYQMIRDAIRTGLLEPGQEHHRLDQRQHRRRLLAHRRRARFPVTLVMPGNVSWARRKITEAFGTKLVFSDPMEGSDGAIRLCRKIVEEDPGTYFYPDQYSNLSNPLAHYNGTGREIWEQTEGRVTHFVTGIGTSGTVMGIGPAAQGVPARHRGLGGRAGRTRSTAWRGSSTWRARSFPPSTTPASSTASCPWPPTRPGTCPSGWPRRKGCWSDTRRARRWRAGLRIARRLVAAGKPGVVVTLFPDRAERYFEAPLPPRAAPAP